MPHYLQYVAGTRLIADPFHRDRWHFRVRKGRYEMSVRGGRYTLYTDDGARLGRFDDQRRVVDRAHAHAWIAHAKRSAAFSAASTP